MQLEMVGKTDIGRQRSRNEDHYLLMDSFSLSVVADGMGGHIDGDIASQIAVDTLQKRYENDYKALPEDTEYLKILEFQEKFLVESIQEANKNIFEQNQQSGIPDGMGTTIVSTVVTEKHAVIAWVGDSRIYLFRDEKLKQVSQDHSLVNELMKYNFISEKDLVFIQNKNIITRALGMNSQVLVDSQCIETQPNDIFLMCSDGLSDLVTDSQIEEILIDYGQDISVVAEKLVDYANFKGGQDNITVTLAKIKE